MLVVNSRNPKTTNFSELEDGECFIRPKGDLICLKIVASPYSEFNAVDLITGEPLEIFSEEPIIKVKSKLEIC